MVVKRRKAQPVSEKAPAADEEQTRPSKPSALKPSPKVQPERESVDEYTPPATVESVIPEPTQIAQAVAEDLRKLAPKMPKEGRAGQRLPKYNIRSEAIAATLAKGLHEGAGLPKLPPGHWRVSRQQTVLIRGQVTVLSEGQRLSSQTHDIAYLRKAGVALSPLDDRAREIDRHGFDYDPRIAADG